MNCHRQGRSPCPRHEVASGGRVREGVSYLPIIFNYKIVKHRSSFFILGEGGGVKVWNENGGKKM